MKIARYVGLKEAKTDNVSGSGHTWFGPGDDKLVTDEQAEKLARHPDVWLILEPEPPKPAEAAPGTFVIAPPGAEPTGEGGEGQAEGNLLDLGGMSDEELRAFADEHSLRVHKQIKGDKLRAAVVAAWAAKMATLAAEQAAAKKAAEATTAQPVADAAPAAPTPEA